MSTLNRIMQILETHMTTPKPYGWFHILFLALTVCGTVFLILRYRNASDKTVRHMLLTIWIVMVALELYKQLVGAYDDVVYGFPVWSYYWPWFPFQFCSTPLYSLPFIIFLPDSWWRRAFSTFFAGFSLFAGLAVMLYPNNVFSSVIGINVQTMVHHGAMVAVGIFMAAYHRRMDKRSFAGSLIVFYAFAAVAFLLNEVIYTAVISKGPSTEFNMFYISRYYPCTLPILSEISRQVNYPIFLLIYLVGFTAVSALFYGIEKGILALLQKAKRQRANTTP